RELVPERVRLSPGLFADDRGQAEGLDRFGKLHGRGVGVRSGQDGHRAIEKRLGALVLLERAFERWRQRAHLASEVLARLRREIWQPHPAKWNPNHRIDEVSGLLAAFQ